MESVSFGAGKFVAVGNGGLVHTSADGMTWDAASPTVTGGTGNWLEYTYVLSSITGASFVKMVWNNTTGRSWSPQIGQVAIAR